MSRKADQQPENLTEEASAWSIEPDSGRAEVADWQGWSEPDTTETASPPLRSRLHHQMSIVADGVGRQLHIEASRGAAFLWTPVCLAIGTALYFQLPREPWAWAFEALALSLLALAIICRNRPAVHIGLLAIALVAGGAGVARLHAAANDTQMLDRVRIATISGEVLRREMRSDGSVRYRLKVSAGELANADGSARIFRITARANGPDAPVGSRLEGLARLGAPSGPAYPGGYDFSFPAWFDGLSGSGFFLGTPTALAPPEPVSGIQAVRDGLASLIRDSVPGEGGGIAAALIVGDRSGISPETTEALRQSGLAHILAISGLHMALVSLTAMGGLRLGFALFPQVALRYPVKKWAAAGGLAAATIYLALSGMAVSTQRAWIMVVIMLGAMILDRRALTMRNVALAALVVMLFSPEAILSAGFQMSFAAVAALVAVYEGLSRRQAAQPRNTRKTGFLAAVARILKRDVGGLTLTSIVAGLATGIFAAYHFQRVAPLGLLANLAAMPVVSVAVMPLALLSMLALPFGLHDWPLEAMAWSTEWVVAVANSVAEVGPKGETGRIPVSSFMCATAGLLIMTLGRSKLKLIGLIFLVPAVLLTQTVEKPHILIAEDGRQIAILDEDAELVMLRERGSAFVTNIWRTAYLPGKSEEQTEPSRTFSCDTDGCSTSIRGLQITQLKTSANLLEDCEMADILVTEFRLPEACSHLPRKDRPVIFDQTELQSRGSVAIYLDAKNARSPITVERAINGAARPWNTHRFAARQ